MSNFHFDESTELPAEPLNSSDQVIAPTEASALSLRAPAQRPAVRVVATTAAASRILVVRMGILRGRGALLATVLIDRPLSSTGSPGVDPLLHLCEQVGQLGGLPAGQRGVRLEHPVGRALEGHE